MARILVSGLINLETTLQIESFPLEYSPVRYPFFGVHSTVSGVGYNLARALTVLGDQVAFLTLIGEDEPGRLVWSALERDGIPGNLVRADLAHTAQSVILYDSTGRRQIHTDLKDIQDRRYPDGPFLQALASCDLAVLCNINFSRPFLAEARRLGVEIATDVHALSSLDDEYNRDFMAAAAILFMSDDRIPEEPEVWARRALAMYPVEILVIGLGARGALLAVRQDGVLERLPAVQTRPVVSTIGAGDALFSAFLHRYLKSRDPYHALREAIFFASYKIGTAGAAEGFLDEAGLEKLAAGSQL